MRIPSAQTLLTLWEEGEALAPFEQGLWLLAAACPEQASDQLALWSIGRRNARLLALHQALFGPQLACLAVCPACAERLELTFRTDDLQALPWPDDAPSDATFGLQSDGYDVRFRLPNSADLAVLAQAEAGQDGRSHLLQRCLLDVRRNGRDERPDELPAAVVEAVIAAMAAADPQADVHLALTCPACGHAWQAPFEIVAYLWAELGAWAERTLREVHALASTYGWREADVLAMSARRRQRYLELAGR